MQCSDFMKFDDNAKCVNSFYKGFHVWFYIRFVVFNAINNLENGVKTLDYREEFKNAFGNLTFIKKIQYVFLTFFRKLPKRKARIIFFNGSGGNMKEGNSYEHRITDFFYGQVRDESISVEESYKLKYFVPRKVKTYYLDYILVLNKFNEILKSRKNEDFNNISLIVDGIKVLFRNYALDDEFWENQKNSAYKGFLAFCFKQKIYFKLLKKINPSIVFRNCASYGGYQALSSACHKLGIVFAEFQHGYIGVDHEAYNYGDVFFENMQLRNLLPSYYLTFGCFWGAQIRHPAKIVPIGFPYLQKKSIATAAKRFILIVSDGDSPSQNKFLIDCVKDYAYEHNLSIVLKLHPCECLKKDEWYSDLHESESFQIKLFEPVYDYISCAKFVIGSCSTVMFETLCFGLNPFVYASERLLKKEIERSIFDTFETKDELMALMTGCKTLKKIDYNIFFSKDWDTAFVNFMKKIEQK